MCRAVTEEEEDCETHHLTTWEDCGTHHRRAVGGETHHQMEECLYVRYFVHMSGGTPQYSILYILTRYSINAVWRGTHGRVHRWRGRQAAAVQYSTVQYTAVGPSTLQSVPRSAHRDRPLAPHLPRDWRDCLRGLGSISPRISDSLCAVLCSNTVTTQ